MTTVKDKFTSTIQSGPDGVELTREYVIQGLSGSAEAKLYNVLLNPDIPKVGDYHPIIPFIRVSNVSVNPLDADTFEVAVLYKYLKPEEEPPSEVVEESQGLVTIGSATQSDATQKDKNGNQIKVKIPNYGTMPVENVPPNQIQPDDYIQTGEVEMQVPSTVLRQTRQETEAPFKKSSVYVGTVNKTAVWALNPRTLLCLRIEGSSNNGGLTYEVNYEFQYKPDTWDATIVYIDSRTDKPHHGVDIKTGEGLAIVRVYQETEFRKLKLSF